MEVLDENIATDKSRRQNLVPMWIKIFGWLFLVMGAAIPIIYIAAIVWSFPFTVEMFGLHHTGSPLDLMGILISTLIAINGLCAFGLLFGKRWGVSVCLFYGYLTLLITFVSMFLGDGMTIRLEPLIQIPYLIKLHKIKALW